MPNWTVENVGWASEPQSRGTIGLLWSCFATIFLCTWSAIHPNLPAIGESQREIFRRRVGYVVGALVMPEAFVLIALSEAMAAWEIKSASSSLVSFKWTMQQAFFINMGGVVISDVSKTSPETTRVDPRQLIELFSQRGLLSPALESSDIDDRSKSDCIVKSIAATQILWFIAQIIGRAANSMSVTTIELFTLSNVCCGAIMYIAWWKKPFDIRTPIVLEVPGPLQDQQNIKRVGLDQWHFKSSNKTMIIWILSFSLFGGLQILAWRFYFPSEAEKWLWRASSIYCSAAPVMWLIVVVMLDVSSQVYLPQVWVLGALYSVTRLYMFVEMFVGLRSVPVDVYQTVQWSQYFPALG
ncbi:hypothetical protein T440DRAFT_388762 [Plenodomus tracheiphilus IPT5]|uniref:Uncharacterized protein n=1 Tax=Plenodomus tracheiphilus IPT5 TaxID=1408161 RepID=A0A6A7BG44_9PLEO|nr:hypothetical protein T440DRAFT_388762 [Plenodomus tracheiphilus IPT5]